MRLSSLTTLFWKMILSGGLSVYAVGVIVYALIGWFRGELGVRTSQAVLGVVFFVAIAIFAHLMLGLLKALRIDGDQLIVSNFVKTIQTPLSNVAGITGPENSSHQRIHVGFKVPTEFGERIVFMPPIFDARSTADALRSAVERAANMK